MNKRLAYGGISTELYNKSLAYSYTKFIGNFEETVRLSFNPINHDTTGNYIVGSRCSAITPWKHGRVLVLKGEGSDPYNASQQKYQVIDDSLTYSTPTRTSGSGTGLINIELLSNATTKGYEIRFNSNSTCRLYNGTDLIAEADIVGNMYILEDNNKVKVTINDDDQSTFIQGTRMWFTVLSNQSLFNSIKIE